MKDELGIMHSRYHEANVTASNAEASAALDKFRKVVASTTSVMEVHALSGDLLIYRNTRIMHRRRAFLAKYDGTDRYYVRVYMAPKAALANQSIIA